MLSKSISKLIPAATAIISLLAPSATALEDYHDLENGIGLQSCAYIANYEDSYRWPLSEHLKPQIAIRYPQLEGIYGPETTVDTLIISYTDLQNVNLKNEPTVKVCDETAINNKVCTFGQGKPVGSRISLDDMIENKQNKHFIFHFKMSPADNAEKVFDVASSDIYCIIFNADGITEGKNMGVIIDWQQSFGKLLVSEYHQLYNNLYLTFAYALLTAIYGYYIFTKLSKDKANAVLNHQTIYNRSLIQFKVLTYLLGSTIVFFLTCLHLVQLNKIGYHNTSFTLFVIRFFTLSSGTLFNTWAIYNFLLLASGVFFGLVKDNKRHLLVQIISGVLLFEFLIYDIDESRVYSLLRGQAFFLSNLIYYELIILFLLSTYWSWQSYKAINNKVIARKLLSTYVLLLIVFSFEFGVHGTNVQNYLQNKLVTIVNMTKWSNILSLVVAALVAFIWRDVRYENNEII
ncbi:unnamed protein product [Ambrosiozyma monospora]|uniref:Unnamed protein product n=1 Tax=Ambrosiozyma monospora TaxID=43982 RepID=A0ACB5T2D8_AMBMO|nr:unnamed protein product [Ambrosiozyma monospora]